jgi:hypothetical protein
MHPDPLRKFPLTEISLFKEQALQEHPHGSKPRSTANSTTGAPRKGAAPMRESNHTHRAKINHSPDRLTLLAASLIDRAALILKHASHKTSNPAEARHLLRLSISAALAAESFRPVIRTLRRTA